MKDSKELVKLAVSLYRKLKSCKRVGVRMGVGPSTVYRWLKRGGVTLPARHSAEVNERKQSLHGQVAKRAAEDYKRGLTAVQLRKKYGVGMWAIRTAAKSAGVELRKQGARYRMFSSKDKKLMARLHDKEGWSQGAIAARFSAHQVTVSRLLSDIGCRRRTQHATGERHGSWKGGRITMGRVYVGVMVSRDDPLRVMANSAGYVLEHRLVMARSLGRPLHPGETVHHIDDDKTNNKLSNLQLRFGRHGKGVALKCRCCGSTDIVPVEL